MITDRLYRIAREHGDRIFLLHPGGEISYAEMTRLVDAYARRLQSHGIAPGDHVVVICGNRPAFLVAWFALARLDATMVPLNTGLTATGLTNAIKRSDAKLLLIDVELETDHRKELAASTGLPVLALDDTVEQTGSAGPASSAPIMSSDVPTDPCTILFTSGTTGVPKGAQISHASYEAAAEDMALSLELTPQDRILVFLPLFHANAQMYAVLPALEVGCSIALLRKFSASRLLADARRYRATGFTYVGTVLSLLEKQNPGVHKDHGLKWCVGGGAPRRIWKEIETRFGIVVRELYGMTETGGWVTMNTRRENQFGSVGRPRRMVQIRIVDREGQPVPVDTLGEITARSERGSVFFDGYLHDVKATAEALRGGWLHTGDRGWLDADGYLYFDGRIKELIRRGGEMIAPAEIELELLKHESVSDCAAIGVPDEIMGEEIEILVVPNGRFDLREIRAFLRLALPRHMWPRYVSVVNHIPRTETQKLKRHELASLRRETLSLQLAVEP